MADLNRRSLDLERLSREVGLAEEAYLLYKKKHEEARISAAMDAQRLVNVTVAQPARPPSGSRNPSARKSPASRRSRARASIQSSAAGSGRERRARSRPKRS